MIPIRDNLLSGERPYVTWTLLGLNVLVFLWDRDGSLFRSGVAFADLAMRPSEVMLAISRAGDPAELGKAFTSMFMHAHLAHLIGNLLFLQAFGPSVEAAIGGPRFALYYIFWGLFASACHIFVAPDSVVPVLGASGAIGGVLGAYFLLFPGSKVTVIVPPLFWWAFSVYAWILLGLWFVLQLVLPREGVANWAHAGGFMAGMATVQVLGGRMKVLRKSEFARMEDEFA